jgi:hypothetical protein
MTARTLPRLLRRLLAGGVVFTALLALLPMSAAQASHSSFLHRRIVERTGQCRSGSAHWDLKTKNLAGGRIYIEFEVDSVPRGARWQMFVSQNGRRIAAVDRRARTSKGVQVNRVRRNGSGRDRIRAAAVNPSSGNTCSGSLRF